MSVWKSVRKTSPFRAKFLWATLCVAVAGLALAFVLLWASRDELLWKYTRERMAAVTGMTFRVSSIESDPWHGRIQLTDLEVHRPGTNSSSLFLKAPLATAQIDLRALRSGRIRLIEASVHADDLWLDQWSPHKPELTSDSDPEPAGSRQARSGWEFDRIDRLELILGHIRWGQNPDGRFSHEVDLEGRREVLIDVESWDPLVERILTILLQNGISFPIGSP